MILIAKPELGSRKSEGYEFAIDLWALGVTLYFMYLSLSFLVVKF